MPRDLTGAALDWLVLSDGDVAAADLSLLVLDQPSLAQLIERGWIGTDFGGRPTLTVAGCAAVRAEPAIPLRLAAARAVLDELVTLAAHIGVPGLTDAVGDLESALLGDAEDVKRVRGE